MNVATVVFGHLAGPECRRALARGWLVVVRGLVGLALALALLFLIWIWWLTTKYNPYYAPESGLLFTLATAALILVTIVVVQAPAVLAGSLAGRARARSASASLDHGREPARDRGGSTAGQAEPGRR